MVLPCYTKAFLFGLMILLYRSVTIILTLKENFIDVGQLTGQHIEQEEKVS